MKHRDYLFMTVLLLILTFSLSEAAIMGPSAGETVGPPSWECNSSCKE